MQVLPVSEWAPVSSRSTNYVKAALEKETDKQPQFSLFSLSITVVRSKHMTAINKTANNRHPTSSRLFSATGKRQWKSKKYTKF